MLLLTALFLACGSLSHLSLASRIPQSSSNHGGLVVETQQGFVQGFINQTAPHVRQFLGIPYAQPPVANLRWLPPRTPRNYTGLLQATAFAPSCIQQRSNTSTIYTQIVPEFLIEGGQSEDCLYLNVFAPAVLQHQPGPYASKPSLLPVFVYIPGGGFTSGGANSLYKIPDKWIERTQSHLVVIMNYRVNLFGFPNAEGLNDLNLGMLDQRRVVEWVHNNIASFGGDPDRMILWGQSAGGFSSDNYGYAWPKNPLVKGIIADSGSAQLTFGSVDYPRSNFTFLAHLVNCTQTNADARLACMRKVPASVLEDASSNYMISGALPKISFTIVPDNKTVFSNTTDRALNGYVAKIPLITGSNTNEGAGFVSYTPQGPGAAVLEALTLGIIACPVAREVRNRVLTGLPVYRYNYAGNFSNISPVSWMGAYHSSELPLLFGTHYEYNGPSTPYEYEVSHFMEALWLSFAQNPKIAPSTSNFTWPQYSPNSDSMTLFASGNTLVQLVPGSIIDSNCTF